MFQIIKIVHMIPKNTRLLGKIKKKYKSLSNFRNFTKVGINNFQIKMFQIIPHGELIKKYMITFPSLPPKRSLTLPGNLPKNGTAA